jgi:hypothetical protein
MKIGRIWLHMELDQHFVGALTRAYCRLHVLMDRGGLSNVLELCTGALLPVHQWCTDARGEAVVPCCYAAACFFTDAFSNVWELACLNHMEHGLPCAGPLRS